jgi:hypothetical protein
MAAAISALERPWAIRWRTSRSPGCQGLQRVGAERGVGGTDAVGEAADEGAGHGGGQEGIAAHDGADAVGQVDLCGVSLRRKPLAPARRAR